MTYTEIKREIAKRLGDQDHTVFRGIIGNSFLQAMCEELSAGECDPAEYPELYLETAVQVKSFLGRKSINYPDEMMKLIDVRAKSEVFTKQITKEEYERMEVEEAFRPTLNEIFWYSDNKFIWLIAPFDIEIPFPEIDVVYLKNPNPEDWNFNVNLIKDLKYGRNFLYKCINKAVINIAALPMLKPVAQGK